MSISISEEKINAQAAALEICRSEIVLEIEKMLDLQSTPWNLVQLSTKLEEYLTVTRFEELKAKIIKNMGQPDIKDYKVQLYLKNFVIEPLLDENYLNLLEILKQKMKQDLIRKFPITTLLLEDSAVELYNFHEEADPKISVQQPLTNLFSLLNVTTNLESICNMMCAQMKYLDDVLAKKKDRAESIAKQIKDNNYVIRVLEKNCGFVLDICMRILEAVINNYDIEKGRDKDDVAKLRSDYIKFIRAKIINDTRKIGGTSPKSLLQLIEHYSKKSWIETKKLLVTDLELMFKNNVYMTASSRIHFKKHFQDRFHETLGLKLKERLGFVPRADIFTVHCSEQVEINIEKTLDIYFAQMFTTLRAVCEKLKLQVSAWMTCMLTSDTKYKYKYFPIVEGQNPDQILTVEMRTNIICAALVSTPKTYDRKELTAHQAHIQHIAQVLEVDKSPRVMNLFQITDTIEKRRLNKIEIEKERLQAEKELNDILMTADLNRVTYILFGLYFLATDAERDLLELRRAVGNNDIATLKPMNFRRRKLAIQLARFLKNGRFHILNYQIVLLVETLLERMRNTHNRYVATKVLKRALTGLYCTDYNHIFQGFQTLPLPDLAKLIRSTKNVETEARTDLQEEFEEAFTSDVTFTGEEIFNSASGEVKIMRVNADQSVAQQTEDQLVRSQSFQMNTPHSKNYNFKRQTSRDVDEQRFLGKLQYLKDNMKKLEFYDLHQDTMIRSRCPIICINGFMCEDEDLQLTWRQLTDLYPFTEIIAINWESFTIKSFLKNFWGSLKSVSFKSLTSLLVESLDKVIYEKKDEKSHAHLEKSGSGLPLDLESRFSNDHQNTIHMNPFEEHDEEEEDGHNTGSAHPFLENAVISTEDPDPLVQRKKPSLWRLWKENKITEVFTMDNLTKAALLITQGANDLNKKIEEKVQKEDDKSDGAKKLLPAFAITTGVYDFYTHNPFTVAYHHAVLAGQLLGLMIERSNMLNSNTVSLCGFSLGSVFAYSTCLTLFDLGGVHKVGDVCLLGSCVDLTNLGQNIHKLIGSKGVIQGKLTIVYSTFDSVLAYMFRSARIGELPLGLKRINRDYLLKCLVENDPEMAAYPKEDLESYLVMKFENVDVSSYVGGHMDYMNKIMRIMQGIDFNSDLQFFKERS